MISTSATAASMDRLSVDEQQTAPDKRRKVALPEVLVGFSCRWLPAL
jgi:hypothetical protein